MIGISIVDTTDTAFSFTDLATITKYDTIISTAITQSERRMKLDSPLTSTFFFAQQSLCYKPAMRLGYFLTSIPNTNRTAAIINTGVSIYMILKT